MSWPAAYILSVVAVCVAVLVFRYLARLAAQDETRARVLMHAETTRAMAEASEITRAYASKLDEVRARLTALERMCETSRDSVDKLTTQVGNADRAREQLEAKVNRLGGGR